MRCSFKIHQRVNLLLIEVQGDWRIFKKKIINQDNYIPSRYFVIVTNITIYIE